MKKDFPLNQTKLAKRLGYTAVGLGKILCQKSLRNPDGSPTDLATSLGLAILEEREGFKLARWSEKVIPYLFEQNIGTPVNKAEFLHSKLKAILVKRVSKTAIPKGRQAYHFYQSYCLFEGCSETIDLFYEKVKNIDLVDWRKKVTADSVTAKDVLPKLETLFLQKQMTQKTYQAVSKKQLL